MEALCRFVSGAAAALCALFAPVASLLLSTGLFIGVDFLTGVAADRAIARRRGRRWYFESGKAWRTVVKGALAVVAVALAWVLESCVARTPELHLARLFAGFICGVELWSFLENAAQLSDAPLFRQLRRHVRRRLGGEAEDE